jgi:hypothetical protein
MMVPSDFGSKPPTTVVSKDRHSKAVQSTLKAANIWFERLCARYTCVWLAEWGHYKDGKQPKFAWMFYRWTDATDWGNCAGRGTGYPNYEDPYIDCIGITRDFGPALE